ncbi:MAG: hypothetical protein QNL78_03800 [Actinomycetes bacterium]
MARRRISIEEEDATSQAGWLFADSFLALMVIFLATISFVPVIAGDGVLGIGKVGNIAGSNYVDGLVLAYEDVDATRIAQDIETYIRLKKLSPTTAVLYVKIIGGYSTQEGESKGTLQAMTFAVKLQKAEIPYFANTKIDLGSSNLIPTKTTVLRLTLSPNGK